MSETRLTEIVEMHLAPVVQAPQMARAFLRDTLHTWDLDGFGEVTELLVSELVANVVTHVHSPMTLRAELADETLRVAVDDESYDPPVLEHPGAEDDHGRGLLLIAQLANDWGTEQHADDGKTVWFRLDVSTGSAEAHAD
jgi:anti-sigma regulatory factor (Ser/Thr protein kinase)